MPFLNILLTELQAINKLRILVLKNRCLKQIIQKDCASFIKIFVVLSVIFIVVCVVFLPLAMTKRGISIERRTYMDQNLVTIWSIKNTQNRTFRMKVQKTNSRIFDKPIDQNIL